MLPIKKLERYPDLSAFKDFDRDTRFCVFNDEHHIYGNKLLKIFYDCNELDELLSTALYVRDRVSTELFVYCYSIALSHRFPEMKMPTQMEIFPKKFLPKNVILELIKCNAKPAESEKIDEDPDNAPANVEPTNKLV